MTDQPGAHRKLIALAQGYQTAALLLAYAELGIADQLAASPRTLLELARAVGADAGALARLLTAAEALGLVAWDGETWRNTAWASETLVSSAPRPLIHFLQHQQAFYRRWSRLAEAVRAGRRPEENRSDENAPDWVRRFTLMLYDLARLQADQVADALAPLLDGLPHPPRILDVGGGHGEYAMALARRLPKAEAVVFDLPPVISITAELIAQARLEHRVRVAAGDFHRDSLGSGYDLALLFGVLVSENDPSALRLLATVRQALAPGGWIAITVLVPGDADTRLRVALRDLHMLLSTDHGRVPDVATVEAWLLASGFVDVQRLPIGDDSVNQLIVARRPPRWSEAEPTS